MEKTKLKTMGVVTLPKRKVFKTPRLLLADAYTVGSDKFQSKNAKQESIYYVTFRRQLHTVNPILYAKGDDRIIFDGLPILLEKLFFEPITHEEIDEAKEFLKTFKATMVDHQLKLKVCQVGLLYILMNQSYKFNQWLMVWVN